MTEMVDMAKAVLLAAEIAELKMELQATADPAKRQRLELSIASRRVELAEIQGGSC